MVHHAHKTCTDWSSTRLYDAYPTLALKSYPTLSTTTSPSISVCSSAASSTTLTPTPSTTPPQPKSFLLTDDDDIGGGGGILSASPPSLSSSSPPHAPSPGGAAAASICTLTDLEALHAGHAFTHLPCPHERCPDPACAAPALHTDAILVSVHGSYFRSTRGGGAAPMAAAAVWFAEGSPLNKVVRLDEEYPGGGDVSGGGGEGGDGGGGSSSGGHVNGGSSFGEVTRQRVELLAGIRALERVADVVRALEEEARRRRRQQQQRKRGGGGGGGGAAMGLPGTRDWYVAGVEKKKQQQQKHGHGMGLRCGDDEEDRDDEDEREMEDDEDGALSQLVLKTHSKYLVRAAVEGLAKWKANGWMNSRGKVVANVDLLWYLDRRITWLEWVGVEVMFLLVGKEDNEGAIKLIGKGLD